MSVRAVSRGGALLVGVSLLAACASMSGQPLNGPVATENGLVAGEPSAVADGVMVFRGIPFAAPPIGDLRWKPPQPVANWDGVRRATEFGPVCMQPASLERTPPNRSVVMPDSPPVSEDCLYLNVWTPAETSGEGLPVMMWVYGGAYYEGAGSNDLYRGDRLAADGVVLVTMNYRLGPLGFLAHPELTAESEHGASGNYALMDVIAALQWVQGNIAAFGGDPGNVTVFGESAGSSIAAAMIGSPEAAGLLQKAIPESGTWMGLGLGAMIPRERAEAQTLEVAQERFGVSSLADLRALPADQASEMLPRQGMIIDGWIVPEDLSVILAEGRQNPVDILTGSNSDEGSFFAGGFGGPQQPPTTATWEAGAAQRWGDLAALGLAAYPPTSDEAVQAYGAEIFNDNMAFMMRSVAEWQKAIGRTAYVYHFQHHPPYAEGVRDLGACHTCEIRYVFQNLAAPGIIPDLSSGEVRPVDEQVSEIISSYWVNFARTGDPNGPGLPTWPMFENAATGPVLAIDEAPAVESSLTAEQAALYDAMLQRQLAATSD